MQDNTAQITRRKLSLPGEEFKIYLQDLEEWKAWNYLRKLGIKHNTESFQTVVNDETIMCVSLDDPESHTIMSFGIEGIFWGPVETCSPCQFRLSPFIFDYLEMFC